MDQVTQQNAALVEQAAAAAESMQQQAHSLVQAVAIFKLEQRGATAESGHVSEPAEPQLGAEAEVEPSVDAEPRVERRGPNRAKNVARLPKREPKETEAPAMAKSGTDDEWSEF
jgi:hypothetical protein